MSSYSESLPTVAQLIERLKKEPSDGVVYVCDMHGTGAMLCVEHDSLERPRQVLFCPEDGEDAIVERDADFPAMYQLEYAQLRVELAEGSDGVG